MHPQLMRMGWGYFILWLGSCSKHFILYKASLFLQNSLTVKFSTVEQYCLVFSVKIISIFMSKDRTTILKRKYKCWLMMLI